MRSSCSAACEPGPLAGGAVTLDGTLARRAIESRLARPLGLSVEDAAAGVIRLLEQNLLHAVERLSIERGHNPATFTLVAAGGAGPMHGAEVARALGCKRALLPRAAGAFCAMGMLQSDVRQDYLQVFLADLDTVDPPALEARPSPSSRRAPRDALAARASPTAGRDQRELDLRYDGQQWPVRVALGSDGFDADAARARPSRPSISACSATSSPAAGIDITALRVVGRGRLDWTPPAARAPQAAPPKPRETRKVWIDAAARLARRAGLRRRGPAAGLHARRAAADRGAHHDRLHRPARSRSRSIRATISWSMSEPCRMTDPVTLDPVTLALVQNRLDHISHQMGWVMTRTARSPIFSQSHDFSCFLADARGTLISQADGIPIHTGGGGFAVRAILRDFKDAIEPEDVFLLNDPYTAGGNHLPDWVIARPVFVAGRLDRLRLQPRPPGRHRRRRGRHLQLGGHRDLPRGHPAAGAEADRARPHCARTCGGC